MNGWAVTSTCGTAKTVSLAASVPVPEVVPGAVGEGPVSDATVSDAAAALHSEHTASVGGAGDSPHVWG